MNKTKSCKCIWIFSFFSRTMELEFAENDYQQRVKDKDILAKYLRSVKVNNSKT